MELLADGEQAAGEIGAVVQREFGISQPAVSQHLRVLRENGFATVRASGARRLTRIEVRLSPGAADGTATLELQHATTLDSHDIGGQMDDAIFCMGGGCYPRLLALDLHLRGTLPDDYDSAAFHLNPELRPTIERGSAAMAALLEADADG